MAGWGCEFCGLSLLCGCGINHRLDFRNSIRGESALGGVLADELLIRRDIDAVNLVLSHVTVNPLNLGSQVLENATGFLGYSL